MKRRFKNIWVLLLAIVIFFLLLLSLLAPYLSPYDPYATDMQAILLPPSSQHLLGTDELGRDEFSRILSGLKPSLLSAIVVVIVDLLIGILIGMLGGYLGGLFDHMVMWFITTFNTIPGFLLAVVVAGVFGPGLMNACIALALVYWTTFARLTRGLVMQVKQENFIKAVRLSGCTGPRVLFRHIIPNTLPQLLVTATSEIGSVILSMSGLSFLGLSSQRPTAEWGVMLSAAQSLIRTAPQLALYAALAIIIVVLIFNLFGDALRDFLDTRQG
jgi:ABC-type dipeptide/oligopeptide/nickel transport system permease subunit